MGSPPSSRFTVRKRFVIIIYVPMNLPTTGNSFPDDHDFGRRLIEVFEGQSSRSLQQIMRHERRTKSLLRCSLPYWRLQTTKYRVQASALIETIVERTVCGLWGYVGWLVECMMATNCANCPMVISWRFNETLLISLYRFIMSLGSDCSICFMDS
jgi:hypothetical protein